MFERFTDTARKVMAVTNQEAQSFNHKYIGPEHILPSLARVNLNMAATVLRAMNVDLRQLHLEVKKLMEHGPDMVEIGKLPQTAQAKKVMEYAIEETRSLNQTHVGTEHLLLGLLREDNGVATKVLADFHVNLEIAREIIVKMASSGINPDLDTNGSLEAVNSIINEAPIVTEDDDLKQMLRKIHLELRELREETRAEFRLYQATWDQYNVLYDKSLNDHRCHWTVWLLIPLLFLAVVALAAIIGSLVSAG